MLLLILTLILGLTNAFVNDIFEDTPPPDYSKDPIYNVYDWVIQLQLQRCALVAVGLKYFAIFVEDEILRTNHSRSHKKYFLGICQQDVLEEWKFCSPELSEQRKFKCRFKLKDDRFQPRVHRRFCDFKVMVNNKDCRCLPSIFGDALIKVIGFPTCYMPPLSRSLCKYNVCGLNQCSSEVIEDRIYTVNCSSKCTGKNSFCERPTERTSRFPVVRSFWSKWRSRSSESRDSATGKKLSVATCINKYTGRGALDCLGPGTGCCLGAANNCSCTTFVEKDVLTVERTTHTNKPEHLPRSLDMYPTELLYVFPYVKSFRRYMRGTNNDDEDLEDDGDDEGDLDEDIALEESSDEEKPVPTTEDLEKEDAVQELQKEALQEIKNSTKSSMVKSNCRKTCFPGLIKRVIFMSLGYILPYKLYVV